MRSPRIRAFLSTAWTAAACGGAGVCAGWLSARAKLSAQGYEALGFERSAYLLERGELLAGTRIGLAWGALAWGLGAAALAASGADLSARRVASWPASRAWTGWASLAGALVASVLLLLVAREREWVAAGHIAMALGAVAALAAALECLGRYARGAAHDGARANIVASLAGLLACFPALAWFARHAITLGLGRLPFTEIAFTLASGALLFALVRRNARRELAGERVRAFARPSVLAGAAGAILLALSALFSTLGGVLGPPSLTAAQPYDVVLIGIDTLRADATSLYGPSLHGRDTTPNLRRLAERGVLFRNAVSQAPWTLPAFGSIHTGRYPHEHGGYSLSGALRDGEVLLAEVLAEAGYATRAVVSHTYVGPQRGFAQGFERYDASNARGHRAISSAAVTDIALRMLAERDERPLFVFAHYFDAHYEYMDHPESDYGDGYQGWLRQESDYDNLLKNRQMVSAEENRWLVDLYEEEIAHTDREIGRLLAALEQSGRMERTLIVVVADHGEEFLDHGAYGHTTTLWQEQLHVPLLVVPPHAARAARVDGVVETRAVFGTVLDTLGVDFAKAARARSLLRHVAADGSEIADPRARAFSITWLPDAAVSSGKRMRVSSLREGRWKLVRHHTWQRTFLYDLEADPREQRDLAATESERAAAMAATLDTWTDEQQNRGAARTVAVDAEELRKLKELGYL
ncbi:MAG: hypothetical protein FJ298_14855 [Planctomycetes bacterium]|nr:hypothetical protein [Planctomycetota bacterium]